LVQISEVSGVTTVRVSDAETAEELLLELEQAPRTRTLTATAVVTTVEVRRRPVDLGVTWRVVSRSAECLTVTLLSNRYLSS
jgi:hypothetical protein